MKASPLARISYELVPWDGGKLQLVTSERPSIRFTADPVPQLPGYWRPTSGDATKRIDAARKAYADTLASLDRRFGNGNGALADLILATAYMESRAALPGPDGLVRAPRTEPGYPGRSGDSDPGDVERDAEDWARSKGAHSSHGVMQTLVRTAYGLDPKGLGEDPRQHRARLANPAYSLELGARYLAGAVRKEQQERPGPLDPVRLRAHYNAGAPYPRDTPWGTPVAAADHWLWVAAWNAAQRDGTATLAPPTGLDGTQGLGLLAVLIGATYIGWRLMS